MEATFLVHDDSRFCELTWEDTHVEIASGWSGEEGEIDERDFSTPSEAREFVAEFLADKRAQGFREGAPPSVKAPRGEETEESAPLFARVLAKPDDLEARLVLGDWLQQHGHARGHLIALQHALEKTPDDAELAAQIQNWIATHRVSLLGELADCSHLITVNFKLGFADSVHMFLHSPNDEGFEADVLVASFLAHPTCRLLRALTLEVDAVAEWNASFDALAAAAPMPHVESLGLLHSRTARVPKTIARVFPNLRELVATGDLAFDKHRLPKLETIAIGTYAADSAASTLTHASFPGLKKLAFADPRLGDACVLSKLRDHVDTMELVVENYTNDLEAWATDHASTLKTFRAILVTGTSRSASRLAVELGEAGVRAVATTSSFRESYGIRPNESLYDEDEDEHEDDPLGTSLDTPPESEREEEDEGDPETEPDEPGVDEDWEAPKENPVDVDED